MSADPTGGGDVTAAAAVRVKFTQLMQTWQRAGASAASVTGISNVVTMQFDAEQYTQVSEVFDCVRAPVLP